jgi:hypothetical protein
VCTGVIKWSYFSTLFPRRTHIPETPPIVTDRQSNSLEKQQQNRLLKSGLVDPAWLLGSDISGPRAFHVPTPEPRDSITTTHDGEQHQQQVKSQHTEEHSRDEQAEQEDFDSGSDSTSSKTDQHPSSSTAASVSLLQCKHCPRMFEQPGKLKYVSISSNAELQS